MYSGSTYYSDFPYAVFYNPSGEAIDWSEYTVSAEKREQVEALTGMDMSFYPVDEFNSTSSNTVDMNLRLNTGLSIDVVKGIEICLLEVGGYRVACREVEHHNVVQFHFAEARYTFIFPLGPFDVRFGVEYRQCMLCQRHGKRRIRYARTITHLADVKEIAYQQGFLQ